MATAGRLNTRGSVVVTRADVITAAPRSARDLADALTAAGWRWLAGGRRSPETDMLRIVGWHPTEPRRVQANWESGRLHSCVVWDATAREASLKDARALVGGPA